MWYFLNILTYFKILSLFRTNFIFLVLHLGLLGKLHTKRLYALDLTLKHLFGTLFLRALTQHITKVQRTAVYLICMRWRKASSLGDNNNNNNYIRIHAKQVSFLYH